MMEKYGGPHLSWRPFAEGGNDFFNSSVLNEIGRRYGKSVAQAVQVGYCALFISSFLNRNCSSASLTFLIK